MDRRMLNHYVTNTRVGVGGWIEASEDLRAHTSGFKGEPEGLALTEYILHTSSNHTGLRSQHVCVHVELIHRCCHGNDA